jgi:hypothetical protein
VDAEAAAPDCGEVACMAFIVLTVVPSCLGGRVVDSCGVRAGPACCVWVVSVLATVHGLGTVWTPERRFRSFSVLSVTSSCLGLSIIGSCGAQPQGRYVAFGCTGFRQFSI